MNELKIIRSLINFGGDRHSLHDQLGNVQWDFLGTPEVMSLNDFTSVLLRWVNGGLSDEDILWWSNAIECREHIDYETEHAELIEEGIFILANPDINHLGPYADLVKRVISDSRNG